MNANASEQFQALTGQIEVLVERVHALPDADARSTALELLQTVMDLHRTVLGRMTDAIAGSGEPGRELLQKLARDPVISGLLVLYDLHPDDLDTRVTRVLEKLRPSLRSHGSSITLVEITEGVVRLRMEGSGNGCQSSAASLKETVEQAVYEAAPDAAAVVIEAVATQTPAGFVPLAKLQAPAA